MKVLVYGGRDYNRTKTIRLVLNSIHEQVPIKLIIEGGATGADRQGRWWAQSKGIDFRTFEANWRPFGTYIDKSAGHWRNKRMLTEGKPNLAIGFPGDRGTADMMKQIRQADMPSLVVREDEHGRLHEISFYRWGLPKSGRGAGLPWVSRRI